MSDLIDRQAAIDAIFNDKIDSNSLEIMTALGNGNEALTVNMTCDRHMQLLSKLPSAQPESDIPVKPIETTDKAWGIPSRQAVCPKCDYYLGHVAFLGDYKGKRITYCETCGQAIDWEGWEFDE